MILVWDTETTGLPKHADASIDLQPHVIEFGGQRLDPSNGEVIDEFSVLINPGVKLEPEITKITGLTDDDLKDAASFEDVWPLIKKYFEGCTAHVAHNLPFDKSMLSFELQRLEISDFVWPKIEICTVGLFQQDWGFNPKLTKLYEDIMGKPLIQAHRGMEDVAALVEIIQHEKLYEVMQ